MRISFIKRNPPTFGRLFLTLIRIQVKRWTWDIQWGRNAPVDRLSIVDLAHQRAFHRSWCLCIPPLGYFRVKRFGY